VKKYVFSDTIIEHQEGSQVIKITIKTSNAAFADDRDYEIARILRVLADSTEQGLRPKVLHDINGNSVGKVEYTGGDK